MILRHSTVTFGVLAAAFAISALYQIYRSTLMEVPEYDAFTPATGAAYLAMLSVGVLWYYPVVVPARIEAGAMGLVGWLEAAVYIGLLFVAGFVCVLNALGARLLSEKG